MIGFAESRLCARDDSSHFALKNFKLLRMDKTGHNSGNRPYHGLALYIKDYFEIQRIEKFHSDTCEFMLATLYSNVKGCFQVVYIYKFPKRMQTNFRNDIHHHLIPLVDNHMKLVIIGDFNIHATDNTSHFVEFMMKHFKCEQHINQSTTDSGSLIDLIFTNCPASTDVIEAYWSDHKIVYCALDKINYACQRTNRNHPQGNKQYQPGQRLVLLVVIARIGWPPNILYMIYSFMLSLSYLLDRCCLFQNSPKTLDLSYKMDLDYLGLF